LKKLAVLLALVGLTFSMAKAATAQETVEELTQRLAEAEQEIARLENQLQAVEARVFVPEDEAIMDIARRISKRQAINAARNAGGAFGEAVPMLGVAAIVGLTAMEIKDACDTIRDSVAIRQVFDPEIEMSDEELTACGQVVPPKEELMATALASPQIAWDKLKEVAPSLDDLRTVGQQNTTSPLEWLSAGRRVFRDQWQEYSFKWNDVVRWWRAEPD